MYINIDTNCGLETLRMFLAELQKEKRLIANFNIEMIIAAATLVMRWKLFESGNCFFQPLLGTAMGIPVAAVWATIYFWWHEEYVPIPSYRKLMLLVLKFIDDMFGVVMIEGDDRFSKS